MGIEEKPRKTLLGVLASKFSDQKENLATEALLHIINSSKASKSAFMDFLKQTSWKSDENLSFKSQEQSADDDSIPDMIGTNPDGDRLVIIENKFWAGLTDNQPNTYVNQLPDGGLLLFVAPSMRLPTIWSEIKRRAIENGQTLDQDKTVTTDLIEAGTGKIFLAVTSWRCLLNFLCVRMTTAGDLDTVSDIKQLMGLCDEEDSDAFIPLRSEDLSPTIPSRVLDYQRIVDKVSERLNELVYVKKNRASSSFYYYAQNCIKGNNGVCIQLNYYCWLYKYETPLWLLIQEISNGKWCYRSSAKQKESLSSLENANPPKVLHLDDGSWIPLSLPLSVEESVVVASVVNQVKEVLDLLP